ncbi:hypothetical protein DICPUDRAFT_87570 [Dictyostelium purpureum]|uniref:Conditioned medium factor n=1 Tax=Dictyostelium purpureum TaxID=5786 RepID=F0ZIZ2_DICPU|nr:uncharacterized protein DICPUDRAFT_87570 [Dictyostelium purpureum]EGC36081.1 hypothetical protein DICPUDRAFT_87570 [Dictyostelium purpureum]|eukprot:XP_003287399.1 hypothetical protein DICPUDRAFT_87570 [Dictyostelium purpureum]
MKLLIVLIVLLISLVNSKLIPKNLSGEPSEFESFKIPNPEDVAQSSDSSLIPITLVNSETTNEAEWVGIVSVDSDKEFTLTIFSDFAVGLSVEATQPKIDLDHNNHGRRHGNHFEYNKQHKDRIHKMMKSDTPTPTITNGTFGIDGATVPSLSYTWDKPTVGDWTIKITANQELNKNNKFKSRVSDGEANLFLLVQNPSDTHIYSYVQSYNNLFVNEKVPILAMLHKKSEWTDLTSRPLNWKPTPLKLTSTTAQVFVSLPDGSSEVIEMFDDGLHDDLNADDGVYGAYMTVQELGNYDIQVVLKGTKDKKNIVRSNQHLIPITTQFLELTGNVFSEQDGDANLNFYYEVESANQTTPSTTPVRLYSEVYGTDKKGNKVAIAWVGGVTSAQSYQGTYCLSANLNARWIAKLDGVTGPFSVKNVIISDLNTFIPLSNQSSHLGVQMIGQYKDVNQIDFDVPLHIITKEMRDGKMPENLAQRFGKTPSGNGKLILVHGYCSSDNPWPLQDFTNAVQFLDLNQNRGNDQFAQMVGEFGAQYTDGFSLVVHSQGGNQALHLLTFYHSGLDLSTAYEGRVIQSMGTPYKGTALAGTLASIGKIIGIGCSANNDLTIDGAALWLNTIPKEKRALVYYTTTQYKTGKLINYCQLAANSVLKWPNDGVIDHVGGELEGGNYVSNIKGFCHTSEMHSPAQTSNTANNKEMDSKSVW